MLELECSPLQWRVWIFESSGIASSIGPNMKDGFVGNRQRHRIGKGRKAIIACTEDSDSHRDSKGEVVCLNGGAAMRWKTDREEPIVMASSGHASAPREHLPLTTLEDLASYCGPGWTIGYCGCDHSSHYFVTSDGQNISIPKAHWHVTAMPVGLGWCIPLVFEDGRLVIPSRHWASEVDLTSLQWTLSR